jgi:UDP:flavonoid glycosyltransferase YjiC (YdhE family)
MIIVPHGHDQPDNAYRVRKLGSRARSIRGAITPHTSRASSALTDDYRKRASDRGCGTTEGGAAAAVAAIEKLLG